MSTILLDYAQAALLWVFLPSLALFAVTWVIARRLDNWSIVDVVWSFGFALLAGLLAYRSGGPTGWSAFALHATMLTLWSLRLGTHLGFRVLGHLGQEDGRYVKMRAAWGARTAYKMGVFYVQQAIALTILTLPLLASWIDPCGVRPVHLLGLALVALAMLGEGWADLQLARFKRDPAQRGQVCSQGLWAWSRHPNYFCEWLIWVGFALLSWSPLLLGIPGLLCAAGMYYLLNHVTGVPLTEAQLLASKGPAYAEYQAKVPAFWPRPPRG
jgi:steroid 5-alpha reductase family enzyme